MIVRRWRGWAPAETADDYQRHYETEVAGNLRHVSGFTGARLLRRQEGDEVRFTSLAFFTSIEDVHAFAGEDVDRAVVEEEGRRALSRWDQRVTYDEVAVEVQP